MKYELDFVQNHRERWGSYAGFILAAIGSAVGLGNIWRFPYIVGTNGGGAFLVPYLIVMFSFGLALMLLEFAVGRHYQTSVVTSFGKIARRFKWVGLIMVGVAFGILGYYMVVLGWILSYFMLFLLSGSTLEFESFTSSWYPVLSFLVVLAINYLVVRIGVKRGIERLNKIGVPLLIAIMIPLLIVGLTLPGAEKGVDFFLKPDFSALANPTTWSVALGQVFFSLSLGIGILLTYGSYLRNRRSLQSSSLIIIIADFMIAFTAGLMIFSIVFAFGIDPAQGTSLVFVAMPPIFGEFQMGAALGALFFMLLFIAGLTSSISIFQVPVASLEDALGFSRKKSALTVSILLLVLGLPSALSYSALDLRGYGLPILDIMDSLFGTFGIAISGAVFVIIAGWFMRREWVMEQVNMHSRIRIPNWTLTVVKIVAPALIIATIASQIFGLL